MNILDLLTRKLSHQLILPESIIDAVINHQWKSAREATQNSNTIEFTNLGTLMVRNKRLEKEIKKYSNFLEAYKKRLEEATEESEIVKNTKSVKTTQSTLDFLLIKKDNI